MAFKIGDSAILKETGERVVIEDRYQFGDETHYQFGHADGNYGSANEGDLEHTSRVRRAWEKVSKH
ncbi:Uncharacterised protein [Mycobacteroides abscessus]|nr:Uncharacterised protein [Mycobacteroides abscessus]CPW85575.1 Uncharacterised protein [Mycobacteroides abscessus]